jgi:hypothetical protein
VAPARLNYAPPPRSIYFDFVGASSEAARLFWPALGVAAAFALVGWLRSRWGLLAFLAAAYYAALTSAEIKNPHYAHFGLPFLCLLAAAVLLAGWLPPPGWVANRAAGRWAWRGLAIAGVAWAAVLVHADVQRLREQFHAPTWDYPPLVVHRKVQPLLEAGHAHFVLYGEYPRCRERTNLKLGFWSIDQFYRPRLVGAEHAATVAELNRLLADGKPAVVFLPPKQPLTDLVPAGLAHQPDRALRLRSERLYYRVLLFHGAEAHLGLAEFFRANEVPPGEPDRF